LTLPLGETRWRRRLLVFYLFILIRQWLPGSNSSSLHLPDLWREMELITLGLGWRKSLLPECLALMWECGMCKLCMAVDWLLSGSVALHLDELIHYCL